MKIGVMLRHIGQPGGVQVYTINVLKTLFNIDRRNRYILLYDSPEHVGKFSGHSNVTEKVLYAPNKLWWDQISVPTFARKGDLDLIYNPKFAVPILSRCKTVITMHGAEQFAVPHAFKWWDRVYFTIANPIYCKTAASIITMTHQGAKDIAKYMGADPKRIQVIYESYNERCRVIEKEEAEMIKKRYSLPERFILWVGGIDPVKNFGNLLKAFHKIQGIVPHKLVVVGFKRFKFARDLQLVDKLNLRDQVRFVGYVADEEIPAFYNLADLFMFPSLYEGFGIPVLEAMACGCPVITSKSGCSPEVAGGAAFLVDPYNIDEIAESIQRVLIQETLREELIEKGFKRARGFSWDKCARETLALFESLPN